MIIVVNSIAIGLYLLAAALQGLLLSGKTDAPRSQWVLALALAGVAAHILSALQTVYNGEYVDLSLFKVSSVISCFIMIIALLSCMRRPNRNLLIGLLPIAALSVFVSGISAPSQEIKMDAGLFAHVITSILAYSLMTIASIQAIILALQERHLKHRHIGALMRALPPLQTMEQMLFELIWIGMFLLTVSLGTGVLFIEDILSQQLSHKIFFTVLAWIIFAILLWGRHQLGWRSKTAVRYTLTGFATLMLGYFGSKIVLELLLA